MQRVIDNSQLIMTNQQAVAAGAKAGSVALAASSSSGLGFIAQGVGVMGSLEKALENLVLSLAARSAQTPLVVGTALTLVLYGVTKAMYTITGEMKTCFFTHVSQNVLRKFALQVSLEEFLRSYRGYYSILVVVSCFM
jgi:hypothetical protein